MGTTTDEQLQRPWHALDTERVFAELETGPRGLRVEEAAERLARYGPNELVEEKGRDWLALLGEQVFNPLVAVLLVAALISFLIGERLEAGVIMGVIAFNTILGFAQEYRAEQALAALESLAAPEAEVVRFTPEEGASVEFRVKTSEVVPGDVVHLDSGSRVPADARVFEATNLEIDESMLTGESLPVAKVTKPLNEGLSVEDRANTAFSGTIVTQGRGKAVVFATGMRTEMGGIARLISETEKAESPLKHRTAALSRALGFVALGASSLILVVGLLRGFGLQEIFVFALAAAVSAIPEGLPAVMTITLAVGVNRMARRNAIIRKLQAVDTLGSTTVVCTDKTGTLTTNQMTVQQFLVGGEEVEVAGVGFEPEGEFRRNGQPVDPIQDHGLEHALRIGALCNDARLRRRRLGDTNQWEVFGDPTEGALVVAAAKAGLQKETLDEEHPRADEVPFDAKERYMATFHRADGQLQVLVKGAPERVLALCADIQMGDEIRPLDDAARERILQANTDMASRALRVLALAYRHAEPDDVEGQKEVIRRGEAQLVFAGLAGMMDPPREEAARSVALCRRAGIRVIMATGDHRLTGEAIARQIGIMDEGGRSLIGEDLERMSDDELEEALEDTRVFARVSPAHKHRIVESLGAQGHIVGMTGDGVNDAPALKAAEIGIAMGITGTDVTKETADMVLTDDNFASIVSAIEEGRIVFENVRRVVKYLIATNVGEILTILSAMVIVPETLIFTPIQILWVNLVTDGILDVTLALEPGEAGIMDEPPRPPRAPIIDREMSVNIGMVSAVMAIGTLWLFVYQSSRMDAVYAQTVGFTSMAMFQVWNSLNCRSRTQSIFQLGPLSNPWLLAAIAVSVILQVAATTVPLLQTALGTVPLRVGDWGLIVLVSASVLVIDEARKAISRRVTARREARTTA